MKSFVMRINHTKSLEGGIELEKNKKRRGPTIDVEPIFLLG